MSKYNILNNKHIFDKLIEISQVVREFVLGMLAARENKMWKIDQRWS